MAATAAVDPGLRLLGAAGCRPELAHPIALVGGRGANRLLGGAP